MRSFSVHEISESSSESFSDSATAAADQSLFVLGSTTRFFGADISTSTSSASAAATAEPSSLVGNTSAGICTFRDNENLHVGEEIGSALLKAITNSKISIPVLFKNYVSTAAAVEPSLLVGEYEVFLSFCGQDTRRGFTDYLYTSLHDAGIRTSLLVQGSTTRFFGADISTSVSASAAATVEPSLLVREYEVFLSSCGQDTHHGFTNYLYTSLHDAGIRTFRDNENLHVGEEMGSELVKLLRIQKSPSLSYQKTTLQVNGA
ncbi:hypothetical protein LguiA_030351 [Lonicera macranthoides]